MEKNTIYIGNAKENHEKIIFDINRGKSIAAYSMLESRICFLFSHLANIEQGIAWEIFHTFQGTRSRNSIVEKLIMIRHEKNFDLFWKSMTKHIVSIDERRNHIVHWVQMANPIWENGSHIGFKQTLRHPSLLAQKKADITNQDMEEFIRKCTFISY